MPLPRYNQPFPAMPITAEDHARDIIDRLLADAGWLIKSRNETNINAARHHATCATGAI